VNCLRTLSNADALLAAGFQWGDTPAYGARASEEEEATTAEHFVNLWCSTVSEYVWTFMMYEYSYPQRFARLLVDCATFGASLQETRDHYKVLLKYERAAHDNVEVRLFLKRLGSPSAPSVRASWILWSNAPEGELRFSKQDARAREVNETRFGSLGDSYANECSNAIIRHAERLRTGHRNPGGRSSKARVPHFHHQLITPTPCPQGPGDRA
jgi:hypothetical protein